MMKADDVRELIAKTIVRKHGGSLMRWRSVIGQIRVYPLSTHPHCNWRADPTGSVGEVEAVERVIDLIGARHPIIC